jgi:hypothetical protein
LYGGLDPKSPIAYCYKRQQEGDVCYRELVNEAFSTCLRIVVYGDGAFHLISTEEELREMFAPIESADEALSYALAGMAGPFLEDGPPSAYYGLKLDPGLKYLVDVIEDTHVDSTAGGYVVHLYHYQQWGCDHPTFYAIDVLVTSEGKVTPVRKEVVYENPSVGCLE